MAATGVIDAFPLAPHLEAAEPPEARGLNRDDVRLLVSHIEADTIFHSRFCELPRWLVPSSASEAESLAVAIGSCSMMVCNCPRSE